MCAADDGEPVVEISLEHGYRATLVPGGEMDADRTLP